MSLEKKLNTLIQWIQDPSIEPAERFQLLQEIAEEAARYKLGGDDKIRVAGGACDGVRLSSGFGHGLAGALTDKTDNGAPAAHHKPAQRIHLARSRTSLAIYPDSYSVPSTSIHLVSPRRCKGSQLAVRG